MPERPDLAYVVPVLQDALVGRVITAVSVRKPVVLRLAVEGPLSRRLEGHAVSDVVRQLHFVRFPLTPPTAEQTLELVVSPMLAGVFELAANAQQRVRADVAVSFTLDDGRQLRYRDSRQMGKVYLIEAGDHARVPGLDPVGLDVLDPSIFTAAAFRALARTRRDQVRVFLMDKSALDAMGNAYADEVLWAARIHPKAWTRQLDDDRLDRLHHAIGAVLGDAVATIRRREPPIDEKLRDFLAVRGRAGDPCPRCQAKLRRARVRGYDAHFCPECQPDDRGSSIVDWRRTRSR